MRLIVLLPVLLLRWSSCTSSRVESYRINTDSIFAMQQIDSLNLEVEMTHINCLQHLRDSMLNRNFRYLSDPQFGNAYVFNAVPDDMRLDHTGLAVGVEPDGKIFLVSTLYNTSGHYTGIYASTYNSTMKRSESLPASHPWAVKSTGDKKCLTFRNTASTAMIRTIAQDHNENIVVTLCSDDSKATPYVLRPEDKFAIAACDTFALILRQLNDLDPIGPAVKFGDN